jgi:hypothetical protein
MHAIRMIETKRDADSALDLDVSRLEEQIATRAIVGIHD